MVRHDRHVRLFAVGAVLVALGLLGTGLFGWSSVRAIEHADAYRTGAELPWTVWLAGGGGFVALFAGIMCCIMASVRFRTRRVDTT